MKTGMPPTSFFQQLLCNNCGKFYSITTVQSFATCCNQPLMAEYELSTFSKKDIPTEPHSMWRYCSVLPVIDPHHIISLGEGMTPILQLDNLSKSAQLSSLLLKDESYNPTGSFKARGISVAVSKAKEFGIDQLIIPTAGNAGGALAAYCAQAKMKCIVVMPDHTPEVFKNECRYFGAELVLVKGFISDCAKKVSEIKLQRDYFDVSTLKEPYRLEGKKTMGYEIAEQCHWKLPDVIIYPAGGGTGLIGIWKAFQEMTKMGWIQAPLPKMMAVQSENCAPLQASIENPGQWKEKFHPQPSIASGLVVPFPFGLDMMKQVIRESGGEVTTVTEKEIREGIKEVAMKEGILLSPEGSATWKAVAHLTRKKVIQETDSVLLLNTASAYKYPEGFSEI